MAEKWKKAKLVFRDVLVDCFTVKNGVSWDLGRFLWFGGVVVYIALSIWSLSLGQSFTPVEWGTGFGLVLAGGGASLMLKNNTEPQGEFVDTAADK